MTMDPRTPTTLGRSTSGFEIGGGGALYISLAETGKLVAPGALALCVSQPWWEVTYLALPYRQVPSPLSVALFGSNI